MSQSASEHAVHFVTPPLRSGRPYENPALPELPSLWSLDHPDTAPIPDEAACRALWTRYAMFSHIERHSECVADMAEALARSEIDGLIIAPRSSSVKISDVKFSALFLLILCVFTTRTVVSLDTPL